MTAVLKSFANYITKADYLTHYADSDERYELINGQIYAMTGSTGQHNILIGNLQTAFNIHLKGKPCIPFTESIKVNVGDNFYYPDVVIDCGFDEDNPLFVGEPTLIIEVLSNSTRHKDLTQKFTDYQKIPTLQEYVIVEQDRMQIDIFRRNDDWQGTRYQSGDKVTFESIGLTLPIEEIYYRVTIAQPQVNIRTLKVHP